MLQQVGMSFRRHRPPRTPNGLGADRSQLVSQAVRCSISEPGRLGKLAVLLALLIGSKAGCSGVSQEPPAAAATRPVTSSEAADTTTQPAAPAGERSSDDAVITRDQLQRVLQRGAQRFIQLVRVRPIFRRGKFFGWRLLAYKGPGPLQPGDIVRRVNRKSIEKPDQFMDVWNELSARDELVVELHRRGSAVTLRYRIVTAAPSSRSNEVRGRY